MTLLSGNGQKRDQISVTQLPKPIKYFVRSVFQPCLLRCIPGWNDFEESVKKMMYHILSVMSSTSLSWCCLQSGVLPLTTYSCWHTPRTGPVNRIWWLTTADKVQCWFRPYDLWKCVCLFSLFYKYICLHPSHQFYLLSWSWIACFPTSTFFFEVRCRNSLWALTQVHL